MSTERFVRNGHEMEIQCFYEQGGGIEELFLWCHTCDPEGDGIDGGRVNVPEVMTIREGELALRKLAFRHSKEQV